MKNTNARRIPTLVALFLLTAVIGVSIFLVQKGIFYIGKAAPDSTPQNVQITNVTDTSFTVAFLTSLPTEALVNLTEGVKNQSLFLDDRDKSTGVQKKYYSHHITVPNLNPNEKYEFTILSGDKEYGVKNKYSVTTGNTVNEAPPEQNPIYGTVLLPDASPGVDVLVIVKNSQSQTVSAITNSKGNFIVPINSLRTKSLYSYSTVNSDSQFEIAAFRENYSATVITSYLIAQSLPPITLSQQYNFVKEEEQEASSTSELKTPIGTLPIDRLSVQVPFENQSFIDSKPQFRGTAYPNADVVITIKDFVQTTIKANQSGIWSYRSDNSLSPDKHEFSVRSPDNTGKIAQITRTFTVFPAGSQVAQSATPSATPTIQPTVLPTATLTPTPTESITIAPTIVATQTPSPTLAPTTSPAQVKITTPTPTIAQTGGTNSTIALSIVSIILIVAGTGLLFIL